MIPRPSLRTILFRLALVPAFLAGLTAGSAPASAAPAAAPQLAPASCGSGCQVTIQARDFPSHTDLASYSFIVNLDNTKLPSDPVALNSESFSPIMAEGGDSHKTVTLPDGRYMVSVRSLDHKMWGAYFTLPADANNSGNLTVTVELTVQSTDNPLPLGKITTYVFNDNAWTNGAPDSEEAVDNGGNSMAGFRVQLDEETDSAVTVDYFNNPLCGDGVCLTDANGFNTIDNLGPAGYFIHITPPDGPCNSNKNSHWIQTTTIDGGLNLYAPVEEGSDGSGVPGEQLWEPATGGGRTSYWFGFACAPLDWPASGPYAGGTGEIVGQARNWLEWAPYTTGTYGDPVENPIIALTDAATDETVFIGRGDGDGNIDVQNVPAGSYNMAIWDEQMSYIMRFLPVTVGDGQTVDVNDVGDDGVTGLGISRWFGWMDGHVYKDVNGNGQYDPGVDTPVGNTDLDQRWRDGSIKAGTFTDPNGYYQYSTAEGGSLGRWIVAEQGFARFSAYPGASITDERSGTVIPSCVTVDPVTGNPVTPANPCIPNAEGGGLLVNQLLSEGHRATIDWGKRDYPPGTPGQIVGITYFATTRNEFDASKQAHEDYEPAIPDVTVLLETPGPDGLPNTDDDVVVNSYVTDHWAQPNASQDPLDNGQGGVTSLTQNCGPIRDFSGADISGLFNPDIGPNCFEVPLNGQQTKEGKFDGGYAFADYCPDGYSLVPHVGDLPCNRIDTASLTSASATVLDASITADDAGKSVFGPGIPDGSSILSVTSGISFELNQAATADGSGVSITIVGGADTVPLVAGDYIVHAIMPTDMADGRPCNPADDSQRVTGAHGNVPGGGEGCLYHIVREEDVNVDLGNQFTEQIPPPPCVGDDHLLDKSSMTPRSWLYNTPDAHAPLCDKKLVVLKNAQNANADFHMMTNFRTDPNGTDASDGRTGDVAEPARFVGQVFNDAYFDSNPMSPWYGEPRPIGGIPIGIYARVDTNPNVNLPYDPNHWRLLTTVTTSPDGSFEALVPSTETFNCPIPQGPCPGMYLITIDDPGTKEHPNSNFDPNLLYETVPAAAWPGQTNEWLDLPLTPLSGSGCDLGNEEALGVPELLQVSRPYVNATDTTTASRRITIYADFIGSAGPTGATGGRVTLSDWRTGIVSTLTRGSGTPSLNSGGIVSWTPGTNKAPDTIVIQVPALASNFPPGPKQLTITTADANGATSSINGITVHVLGTNNGISYNPPVVNVAQPPPDGAGNIQAAIDSAAPGSLIVLSPGTYNENLLLWKPVKLQGIGPGGIIAAHELQARAPEDPRFLVKGSLIDGRYYQQNLTAYQNAVQDHKPYAVDPTFSTILSGADITLVAQSSTAYDLDASGIFSAARIDGLGLQTGHGDGAGGIQLQANINNLQIANNILENNGGLFAGGIGLGQPYAHGNHNYNVRMDRNRVVGNGAMARAGGVGIFYGSNNYEIANSVACSNFGFEYGAGISHWGYSPNGSIHDNRVYYNDSVDSGAGISIQGETPVNRNCDASLGGTVASCLGDGTGAVSVDRNLIEQNYSGDDGGGIFILNALAAQISVRNNMVVNNGAADLGGAIMLDDASNVRIINNTVANNVSTASSENSALGVPHAAGLVSEANEPMWQTALGPVRADTVTICGSSLAAGCTGPTSMLDPSVTAADLNKRVGGSSRLQPGTFIISVTPGFGFQVSLPVTGTSRQNNVSLTLTPAYFANPAALFNNIFWNNEAFTLDQWGPGATLTSSGYIDFEVHGTCTGRAVDCAADTYNPRFSDLTNSQILGADETVHALPGGQGNLTGSDPLFAVPVVNELSLGGARGDPQQVAVTITGEIPPVGLASDYHILVGSPAINAGAGFSDLPLPAPPTQTPSATSILAPCSGTAAQAFPADFDRDWRPRWTANNTRLPWDLGADEAGGATVTIPRTSGTTHFNWNDTGQLQCANSTVPVTP